MSEPSRLIGSSSMSSVSRARSYRAKERTVSNVIGLSISYDRENLLSRGLGLEHLKELLIRLARELIRQRVHLAYGGHWKETEDNFTYELLRLISAEQQDNSLGEPDPGQPVGRLFNHSPWPGYLEITPRIEAQWIDSCRIVRLTQQDAGIDALDVVPDAEARSLSDRSIFNAAVTLSAMRRISMEEREIPIPDVSQPERIPGITARIALGGKLQGYSGFLPGIFEEALNTIERGCPMYMLGGFGGAAEALAKAILSDDPIRPEELTVEWHVARTPMVKRLQKLSSRFPVPPSVRTTEKALEDLFNLVVKARSGISSALNTCLTDDETRDLMTTRDMGRVIQLVRSGLQAKLGLTKLPA